MKVNLFCDNFLSLKFKPAILSPFIASFVSFYLFTAQSVQGQANMPSSEEILSVIDDPAISLWISGVAQGIQVANEKLGIDGREKIFCMPMNVPLDENISKAAFELGLQTKGGKVNPRVGILRGLEKLFPCN